MICFPAKPLRGTMRSFIISLFIGLAVALPSAVEAKTKKPDTPEDKLNCKQLTGRIQVKIMEMRGFSDRKQASILARGIQSGFSATLGNESHGIDPNGEYQSELNMLQRYNQRLVTLGCKSYDLNAELNKRDIDDVPAPTILPPKKAKAKP